MLRVSAGNWTVRHGLTGRSAHAGRSVTMALLSFRLASTGHKVSRRIESEVTPSVVNMYETRTYFPFRYEGELPEGVVDLQWRQQIRNNLYSKIKFQEQLSGSTISSLQMKCKNGSMKLELPAQVEVNGVTGMMHRAHVNYFSNNIGIASITFHPARITADEEAVAAQPQEAEVSETKAGFLDVESGDATVVENKYRRSSIKDVLDVQQAMLGNEKILLDHSQHQRDKPACSLGSPPVHKTSAEAKKRSGFFISSVQLRPEEGCVANHEATVQKLLDGIIDYAISKNPHIKSWERLPFGERPFIVNRVEVDYSEELAASVATTLGEANADEPAADPSQLPGPNSVQPSRADAKSATEGSSSGGGDKEMVRGWDRNKLSTWTYALSSFAWTEKLDMQDNYLDKFIKQNCYLRFASDYGGLWQGFRNNGGAAVYFHHYDAHGRSASPPLVNFLRLESRSICADTRAEVHDDWMNDQNHWPSATDTLLQLVPSLLYQRTFLQMEVQRIRKMINKTAAVKSYLDMHDLLSELKDVEGRLLRFNLKFCDGISQDMAAQEVFDIWQRLESLTTMKENLVDHVQELSAFYRNISAATQQDKLDLLTVMVVNLGLAQILYQGLADGHSLLAVVIVAISVITALYYHAAVLNRSVLGENVHMPVRKFQKSLLKRLRVISVRLPIGSLLALLASLSLAAGTGYRYREELLRLVLTSEETSEESAEGELPTVGEASHAAADNEKAVEEVQSAT